MSVGLGVALYVLIGMAWAYVAGRIADDEVVGVFGLLWPIYSVIFFFFWLSKLGKGRR